MNYKWDKKYLYWGVTAFLVIAASAVFFLSIYNFPVLKNGFVFVVNVLKPILYGFSLAYLLAPIMNFFEKKVYRKLFRKTTELSKNRKKKKNPSIIETSEVERVQNYHIIKYSRIFGVATTIIISLAFLVGLVSAVLPQLIYTFQTMGNHLPEYLKTANKWLLEILEDYPEIYDAVYDALANATTLLKNQIMDFVLPQMTSLLTNVSSGIIVTVSTFFNWILGFIICIYFLYGKEMFAAQGKKLIYSFSSRGKANLILRNLRHLHKTFGAYLTGKIIDCIIVGVVFFIILSIFNMPYVLLISVFLGITNFIPYFGPFIGGIPCALLILLVDPIMCLEFIIIVLVVQQIDGNILVPKILGDNTGLSGFWVIFSILVGDAIFGFVGLLFGVPVFAVFYSITKASIARRLEKKGLPSDTNQYKEIAYFDRDTGDIITLDALHKEELALTTKKQKPREPSLLRKIIFNKGKKK